MDDRARCATRRRACARRIIVPGTTRPSDLLASFFAAAICALLLAAAAGIAYALTGLDWLHWTALHLALLGGVSQLVVGAGQFFSCAFLATDPPSRRMIGAQLLAWNAGTVLVAVGVPTAITPLVDAGGLLLAIGLVLFAISLRGMQRRSLQRARWALRWYQACADTVIAAGWLALLLAAALLEFNLLASLRGATATLALPARLIALAQTFLPAALLLALVVTLNAGGAGPFVGPARSALAALLLVGWIGLTVAGSLLHLLALLARVRNFARAIPASRPALDWGLTAAAGVGVGGLALSDAPGLGPLATPAGALVAAVGCLLATRVGTLAISAARPMRPAT